MSAVVRLRGVLLAVLAGLAISLLTPVVDHAGAEPSQGGGGKVTCDSGGAPGDVMTVTQVNYIGPKAVDKAKGSFICGKDGQWHLIGKMATPQSLHPGTQGTTLKPTG